MLIQVGSPSQVKAITFPDDTARTLSVHFRSNGNTSAEFVYTIGPEVPNVTFADGSRELRRPNVQITPLEVDVSTPVSFRKTGSGPVVQIPITGVATETGGVSAPPVRWFVAVLQTETPGAAKAAFTAVTGDEFEDREDMPDPLHRAELERAARLLRTLQAAVDAALDTASRAPEAPSERES